MKTVKLGDVCEVIAGQSPVGSSYNDRHKGIEFHQGKKLFGENDVKESNTYTAQPSKIAEPGDILMSVRAPVGPVNYTNRKICIGRGLAAIRVGTKIDKSYLFHFLRMNELNINGTEGATFASINKKDIESIKTPLPSLEDQRRVVERLDAAFEKIDRAIELTEKNIQNTRIIYDQACVEIFRNVVGEECSLGDVCAIDSKLVDPQHEPYSGYLHVGGANIKPETGELINLKTAEQEKLISGKFPFDETMVLYSKIRPYLKKVARPDFTGLCSADVYPLAPMSELRKDYLYYLLLSEDFTQYAISGSDRAGMPKVNRPHLFAYTFTLPSASDQDEIVNKLDGVSAKASSLNAQYQSKATMLRALKQSLLTQAFSQGGVE